MRLRGGACAETVAANWPNASAQLIKRITSANRIITPLLVPWSGILLSHCRKFQNTEEINHGGHREGHSKQKGSGVFDRAKAGIVLIFLCVLCSYESRTFIIRE